MISRRTLLTVSAAAAAAAFIVSSIAGWSLHRTEGPGRIVGAHWKERFQSPPDLARGVDVIALAVAVEERPGQIAWSDGGEDSLSFEEISFDVVRAVKGVSEGERLVVERAGGVTPDGESVMLDSDGGLFAPGGTYLLFLRRQEDGPLYYQVNDQGRFEAAGSRLVAVDPADDVAGFFHGRPVDESLRILRTWIGEVPGTRR